MNRSARLRLGIYVLAGLAVIVAAALWSQSGRAIRAEAGAGWELVWNDEFSGSSIDATKWSYETNCWGGGNGEQECYTDRSENSAVTGGRLVISAKEESFTGPAEPLDWKDSDPANTATLPYTSARLRSLDKGDFTYGRIEVRAKLPGGQGIWPAIWMLPSESKYGPWAASGEIDIMEAINLGTSDELPVYGTLHYGGAWPGNTSSGAKYVFDAVDPRDGFHTYAIEWARGEIRWYVDGVQYATQRSTGWYSSALSPSGDVLDFTDGAPFDQPFHLLLNLAVGGAWPGNPDATTQFPATMEVDYVRVFSCPADPETLATCATIDRDAELVAGHQPEKPVEIEFDPGFINQDVVTVMADEVVGPYAIGTYSNSGSVDTAIVDDGDHGAVTQMTFNSDESVVYFQSKAGYDFTPFSTVNFDLKVVTDPRSDHGMFMKMDCTYPCGTGDFPIGSPPLGEWTHYSIPIADLVSWPGSTLDVTKVNTPLVIFPTYGNQDGVVMEVDNVTVDR